MRVWIKGTYIPSMVSCSPEAQSYMYIHQTYTYMYKREKVYIDYANSICIKELKELVKTYAALIKD